MKRQGQHRQSSEECRQHSSHLDAADATDGNPLGLRDLPPPPPLEPWRWLGLFTFVLLSMAMLATLIVSTAAKERKTALIETEEKRLSESVTGRIKVLETWLDGQRRSGRRLTDSRVFRLFIADLGLQNAASPLPRSLQDQRPYFLQLMADFVRQNDLARAVVLKDDGTVLLSSPGPALNVGDLLKTFEQSESGWTFIPSAIRRTAGQDGPFVIDLMMGLPAMQAENEDTAKSSAILVLTVPADRILKDVLANSAASPDGEAISLLQRRGGVTERLLLTDDGIVRSAPSTFDDVQPGMPIVFGLRNDDEAVYALGEPAESVAWTLIHAVDARAALSPVHHFIKVASVVSALAVLALTAAFAAFWWRQGRNHHRLVADFHKAHAARLDSQHQFLRSITTSIGDWLAVSAPDGKLIYANPAFEDVTGSAEHPITGKTWDELVIHSPADEQHQDHLSDLIESAPFEQVQIGGRQLVVSSKTSNLATENGEIVGSVHIVRDHTEAVTERQRRLSSASRTIDAFIHAIELRDPFLLGHTKRVRTHAIAIGKTLGLTNDALASLALAASLSQIGKIFVPDHILSKPERHGADETAIMMRHSLHAVEILERIDLDLPIVDIIAQMHERLDGSGYPHGLVGDQIGSSARILGVADVFCARTAPRSYRDRISAGKTLYHLASNQQRYDLKVVAALADFVGRGEEIEGFDSIERSFIDAAAWKKKGRVADQVAQSA